MLARTYVALVTPFTQDGEVCYQTFSNLIQWHLSEGTEGFVIGGTTGEAPTLTGGERTRLFEIAIDLAKGKASVVFGVGTYCTRESVLQAAQAKKMGADACMVIVPYYNLPNEEGVFRHFVEIDKVGMPTILYHHPGRTGIRLSHAAIDRIMGLENLIAVKDCSGMEINGHAVYSGVDSIVLERSISVIANAFPKLWREDPHALQGIVKAIDTEVNPQGIKCLMELMGLCSAAVRLPLVEASKREVIERALNLLRSEADQAARL
ncbi:MAG: dihydrodipicolinate synthase family protein [Simkaniaceae bacterium]|nr:dihydrodipicolinate synthase family protein [Simkaniaceae bacterium]